MLIDKVGGISFDHSSRPIGETHNKQQVNTNGDYLDISQEATRKAEQEKVIHAVNASEEPERAEKLRQVHEKLQNNEYDQLNPEQLDTISESLVRTFFG